MDGPQSHNVGLGKVDSAGWIKRSSAGSGFSARIFDDICKMGCFSVALNGTEHTHPRFIESLRRSEDQTSLSIRYAPDGVISGGSPVASAYVEAKNSIFIEKNAYENYRRLASNGCIVAVVLGYKDEIRWHFVEQLHFDINEKYNRKWNWPVVDGWMCPRLHPEWARLRNNFPGSGTPYRPIDFVSLYPWEMFKIVMLAELTGAF